MSPTALFGSILFDRPADQDEHDDPPMFSDLNLNQVFDAVTAGREEHELMSLFRRPLRDVRAVEYRHQVQRDLKDKAVAQMVAEFADRMREMRKHDPAALFLRAERRPDGQRTFRVPAGEPLPTSYGEDLYQQVFGTADQPART